MKVAHVMDPMSGFVVNDTITFRVDLTVEKNERYSYDSRKETGSVGLKNQGATCYMNSLLQYLYNIPFFRKAVYHMPTLENDEASASLPLALQSVFYKLQYSNTSVSTKDLTKSFGWGTSDAFLQHDVQELNRGTLVEKVITQLFEGHTHSYISCMDVDYSSTRKESFMDLQLDVKGCKNMYDSFTKYCEDAKKGVLFESLPPVLQLQLKRFEYDFQRDTMVKINDRYEFSDTLDLDFNNGACLASNCDRSIKNLYRLHSVLVHSGGVHGGHYFAYVRPDGKQWLKFDDDKVTLEHDKSAMDDQFGMLLAPIVSAFSLSVACSVARDEDIHKYVGVKDQFFDLVAHDKLPPENIFRVKKNLPFMDFTKMVEAQFGVPVASQRYWTWEIRQNGTCRISQPLSAAEEQLLMTDLKEYRETTSNSILVFVKRYDPDTEKLRFVFKALLPLNAKLREILPKLILVCGYEAESEIEVFEEVKSQPTIMVMKLDHKSTLAHLKLTDGDILIVQQKVPEENTSIRHHTILKHLEYVSNRRMVTFRKLEEPSAAGIECEMLRDMSYNEVSQALAPRLSLDDPTKLRFTQDNAYNHQPQRNPMGYRGMNNLEQMLKHQNHVNEVLYYEILDIPLPELEQLKTLRREYEAEGDLEREYEGEGESKREYEAEGDLEREYEGEGVLPQRERRVLERAHPPSALVVVSYHNEKGELMSELTLRLPKESLIEDVLEEFQRTMESSTDAAVSAAAVANRKAGRVLRLMEVYNNKVYKVLEWVDGAGNGGEASWGFNTAAAADADHKCPGNGGVQQQRVQGPPVPVPIPVPVSNVCKICEAKEGIEKINDGYWNLRAEAIPEDQLPGQMSKDDHLIHCYHMSADKDNSHVSNFGDPFLLRISKCDLLGDVKARIKDLLGISDEEFAKWEFAFISVRSGPVYLKDDDALGARFAKAPYSNSEHEDKGGPRRNHGANRNNYEQKAVKIFS
eukprot:gene25290-10943_t